jgi:hypothetical protein
MCTTTAPQATATHTQWALITKGGRYRPTGLVTDAVLARHLAHGWTVVATWQVRPSPSAVTLSSYVHAIAG